MCDNILRNEFWFLFFAFFNIGLLCISGGIQPYLFAKLLLLAY